MSFRKLFLSLGAVAAIALFGAQASGAGALSSEVTGEGTVTAKEVRDLILKARDYSRVRNRIDPKRASIDITTIKVKSNSCKKGTDWYRYFVYPDRNGGLLCNGERDWRMTHKRWGPPYFNGPMRQILDYILVEDDLDTLGPGRVKRIESNGNVATVTYKVFKYGKYTGLDKELRIVGSTVSVGEPS